MRPGGDGVRLLASTIAREPTRAAAASHGRHDRVMRFIQATGAQREDQTDRQLRRILGSYPVSDWVFTRDIRIEANAVPHSHPVLTLNTRHLDDDHQLLATFIHEQLHWGVTKLDAHVVAQLAQRHPDLPIGAPDGCRSTLSNYLHIVICSFEHHALTTLLGPTAARATLQRQTHYKRIYEVVLADHDRLMPLIHDFVKLGPRAAEFP